MCGIVGYVGKDEAGPVLLHGLQRLEYRGYDSSGLAVRMNNEAPIIVKAEGKLINLIEKTKEGLCFHSNSGIGHTRWATHGNVSISLSETQKHIVFSLFKVRYMDEKISQSILHNGGNIKCVK